jgi:hypothetical protein
MREVVFGYINQYKITDEGKLFTRVINGNRKEVVLGEEWKEKKATNSACDASGGKYLATVISLVKGKNKSVRIHRLVAEHFVDGFKEGLQVNHIDGNRLNNKATNLEWVTPRENIANAKSRGALNKTRLCGKIDESKILAIATMINTGIKNKEIAKFFNIDSSVVSKFKTRKRGVFQDFHDLIDPVKASINRSSISS